MPDAPFGTPSGPHPALFVIDLVFPGTEGSTTVSAICRELPPASLLAITMAEDPSLADQILEAEADSFLGIGLTAADIMAGIKSARAGKYVVKLAAPVQGQMTERLSLTPRQMDVLRLLAKKMPNKMIARDLGLSHFTVRNHVSTLMRRLQVKSRNQLGPRARALGLLTTGELKG